VQMALPKAITRYTPQEYYALEHDAQERHDYYQGEIYPTGRYDSDVRNMAGGTRRHSRICSNIIREIGYRLKGSDCAEYESNLRLRIKTTGLRTYPDASIYCGAMERDEEDPEGQTFTNPTVVFEVLSPSTEAYDRGFKAENYRQIPSLQAYLLISQDAYHVEIHERNPDNKWSRREVSGKDAMISIPAIAVELPLLNLYDQVDVDREE